MLHNKVQLFISGKHRSKSSNIFSHLVISYWNDLKVQSVKFEQ